MSSNILKLKFPVEIDESIESYQYIEKDIDQSNTALNNPGELTITFQNQDAWLLPSDSYLRIEGTIKAHNDADLGNDAAVAFVNNGIMQLFTNVRYFLGTQLIEYYENVGITTTIHNLLTKSSNYNGDGWFWIPDKVVSAANVNNERWKYRKYIINAGVAGENYNFSAMIPLNCIFNFCNDFNKVIYGMQHKISLTRTTSTRALMRVNGAIAASGIYPAAVALANDAKVVLSSVRWCMPEVRPSISSQVALKKFIDSKDSVILSFLNKRCENIAVPESTKLNWKLQLSGGIERPRYLVVAFQTGRGENQLTNSTSFDKAPNVLDAYVTLNGIRYPYTQPATDLATKKYTYWYREYLNFYKNYNRDNNVGACLSYADFINCNPLYIFDVSKQPEKLKNSTIDATIIMTFAENAAANTQAYCVMYYDSLYELVGDVNKQIIKQINFDK